MGIMTQPIMPNSCGRALLKKAGHWGEGSWVRVPMGTVYYIITKVFNYKKKKGYHEAITVSR